MKVYNHIIPITHLPVDDDIVEQPAKLLGSSIADGRYNGVCDGSAGLLRGQYDNDSSMAVDPLCDMATDSFSLRQSLSVPQASTSPGDSQSAE